MRTKFYMLVGLPGSGKSTLAKRIMDQYSDTSCEKTIVWISSDYIRKEMYGSENVQGNAVDIFAKMLERTKNALNAGQDVIYDATNISSKKRKNLLDNLKKYKCEKICIICATSYNLCVERARQRDRIVEENVIKRMYMNWNTPYYFEGWDDIHISYSDNAAGSLGTPADYAHHHMEYKQDNPYHAETLGEHMKNAQKNIITIKEYSETTNISISALLHDCGKPFTKTFTDKRGNKTEYAHYYQHENVGAYDAMFYDFLGKSEKDILEISMLINLHMEPFSWHQCTPSKKQVNFYGEAIVEKILLLHSADKASSIVETDVR